MNEHRDLLLTTSIRMYSLYQTALSLCSVKRLSELIDALLPQCITAMDVATACLLTKDSTIYLRGKELGNLDKEYLRKQPWNTLTKCIHAELPSGKSFLAYPILQENEDSEIMKSPLGTLIVVDKEVSDFDEDDFDRMKDLTTITATALGNVYEYENLILRTEDLEEDIKRRNELELQRLRQELEDAKITQLSLLPRQPPYLVGFDINGICLPAREVGGDFYDYVPLGDNTLAIILADVSGKGLKGAMYAVLSFGFLHAQAKFGVLPSQMLSILNEDLHSRIQERMNCAMCIATIDLDKRILRYSNAGIPYPIVKRDGKVFELEAIGAPLGGFRNFEYADIEMKLSPGDVLVLLSDGITECTSKDDQELFYEDTERLFSVISKFDVDTDAQAMINAIRADVRDFSGDNIQNDDITIVVVKVGKE